MIAPGAGPIALHKLVSLDYVIRDDGGELVSDSKDEGPLVYVHGTEDLLPGLEHALEGKTAGQRIHVELPPGQGYGPPDEDLVRVVQRARFDNPERIGSTAPRPKNGACGPTSV